MHSPSRRGFTLIELMITVAVVAILAAVAYPSYQDYVRKSHRRSAQSAMMDIANRQQQYLLANRRYATTLAELSYTVPTEVSPRYTCTLNGVNNVGVPTFIVACTAIGSQVPDGNLSLNERGEKGPSTSVW